jgi:hypothetical protein
MKLAVVTHVKENEFEVWAMLNDDVEGDPSDRPESFIIGFGNSRREAIADAERTLQSAADQLIELERT